MRINEIRRTGIVCGSLALLLEVTHAILLQLLPQRIVRISSEGPESADIYRNQALLDRGMGIGEYTYYYVLAYYSWLGHLPGDGPAANTNRSYIIARPQSRMHGDLTKMLSNQLESASDRGDSEEWNRWRLELAGEIEKMENGEDRIPWEDSVPAKTAESLEPFRDRLEQTYTPLTNPFELSLPGREELLGFGRK